MYGLLFIVLMLIHALMCGGAGILIWSSRLERLSIKKEKKRIDNVESQFREVLSNLITGRTKFKTRVNLTTYISVNLNKHGDVDLLYLMNKGDIAIFKGSDCLYTSDNVDSNLINNIINGINKKHKEEIEDVVNFFGIVFTRAELEKSLGVKWEDFKESIDKIFEMTSPKKISEEGWLNNIQFDIDDILDKIGRFGMNSLTLEERKFLDDYSKT
jgi:hypothetical protein